jgi:hypothetical protein
MSEAFCIMVLIWSRTDCTLERQLARTGNNCTLQQLSMIGQELTVKIERVLAPRMVSLDFRSGEHILNNVGDKRRITDSSGQISLSSTPPKQQLTMNGILQMFAAMC